MPVMQLGSAVYSEDLAAAFDKSATLSADSLIAEVNKILEAMHADGTLSELSIKWFGMDLTQAPN
jgi:polar amino acid transport system substrate-binding protein